MKLYEHAEKALRCGDIDLKLAQVDTLYRGWQLRQIKFDDAYPVCHIPTPGRPDRPVLVHPSKVEKRKLGTAEGRAVLIHAIAHIEFNAINLALDAVYRFRGLPMDYYGDWLRVAYEEAYHFRLLRDRLTVLGFQYGDFTAHDGLWTMAVKTADDPLARMALVPRILEARGLDVTPGIQAKLRVVGDTETADILDIILRDEIGHVAIGNCWYRHLCALRGLDVIETFKTLYRERGGPGIFGELNWSARVQAGFDEAELALLKTLAIGVG